MPTEKSWTEVQNDITVKSLKDVKFRQQLVSDPKATLSKEYGIVIPKDITIHVHLDTPTEFHFTLPPALSEPRKLTESELESVAGGNVAGGIFLDGSWCVGGVRG